MKLKRRSGGDSDQGLSGCAGQHRIARFGHQHQLQCQRGDRGGDADILVSLNPGHRPTSGYVQQLRLVLNREFPGTVFLFLPADIVTQTINFGLPAPFDIQIVGRDLAGNRQVAAQLANRISGIPGAVDLRVQQPDNQPHLRFDIDRTKASELGLTERDVANAGTCSA